MTGAKQNNVPHSATAPSGTMHQKDSLRRRLAQRLLVRLRQNWKVLTASLATILVLVLVFGAVMVRPVITSALSTKEELTENVEGTSDLFDVGKHSIDISYNETEYQDMIKEFQTSREKNFMKADLTIDGTVIENVGIRLKGNSTLMSLRNRQGGGENGQQAAPGFPVAPQMPAGVGVDSAGDGSAEPGAQGAGDTAQAGAQLKARGMGRQVVTRTSKPRLSLISLVAWVVGQEGHPV